MSSAHPRGRPPHGDGYQGEELQQGAYDLSEALQADRWDEFVLASTWWWPECWVLSLLEVAGVP